MNEQELPQNDARETEFTNMEQALSDGYSNSSGDEQVGEARRREQAKMHSQNPLEVDHPLRQYEPQNPSNPYLRSAENTGEADDSDQSAAA